MLPEGDILSQNKQDILKFIGNILFKSILIIDIALGARALEELILGNGKITSGCSSDLQNATRNAYSYIIKYGMDDEEANLETHQNILSNEDVVSGRKYPPNLSEQDHFRLDSRANQLIIDRFFY